MDIRTHLTTSGDSTINTWNTPQLMDTREVGETIELTYLETSMIINTGYPYSPPARRVFKIIYSCVDGKWNKSERIYGRIEPATNEHYTF